MFNAESHPQKQRIGLLLILAAAATALLFVVVRPFVVAVLLGAIFGGLSYPFYRRVVRWCRGRETLAAGVTILLGLLGVVIPALVFFGLVASAAVEVSKEAIPWVEEQIADPSTVTEWMDKIPFIESIAPHKSEIVAKSGEIANKVAQFATSSLAGATRGTARFFLSLFIMLYAMFYFLAAGPDLPRRMLRAFPLSDDDKQRMLTTFTSVARATLIGAVVIGVIQGGLAAIAFAVVGIQHVSFWFALMAVLSIIPGIGAALVWVPAVIYLAIGGHTAAAIGLAVWCAVVVGSVDNVLRPRLVGKGTGLPDLLVLLGTLGGLMVFGAAGLLIGPIIAALFVTTWQLYATAIEEGRATVAQTESASQSPG